MSIEGAPSLRTETNRSRPNVVQPLPPSEDRPSVVAPVLPVELPARLPGFRGSLAWGLVRAVRPRQWVKNGLVLAAPLVSGRLLEGDVLADTAVAFVLFCAVASAVYLINDSLDVAEDRRHPVKRMRPIAAGIVPRGVALALAAVLIVAALTVAVLLTRPQLAWVLGIYVAVQLAYCLALKHQPVIDLAIVSSGFLLRAVAGGVAAGIPLSQWFLLVAAFGSLFMVAGKRYSEMVALGEEAATRRSLREYSESYLRFVWSMSAGVTVTVYSLWAFDLGRDQDGVPWSAISIAPFVLGLLRHAVDLDKGAAGEPEDVVLHDPVLLSLGAAWIAAVALGVAGV